MKRPIRVVITSDRHHGSIVGLTPPGFDVTQEPALESQVPKWRMRRAVWDWFDAQVKQLGQVDVLLDNGDAIDGKGQRSGGTEQLFLDRGDQTEMAVYAINEHFRGATKFMSFGTSYHVGTEEDWEQGVAQGVKAEIHSEDTLDIRGVKLNYKHHISGSSIPHGRFTALARDKLWNTLWSIRGEYPVADVVIRSHVHYFGFCGVAEWMAFTTPSLQGYGSKFGARRMSGTVDVGFIVMDITGPGEVNMAARVWRAPFKPPTIVEVDDRLQGGIPIVDDE